MARTREAEWSEAKRLCRLSAEEGRMAREREDIAPDFGEDGPDDADGDSWLEPESASEREIEEEDRLRQRRQESFRAAADYVAVAFAGLATVEKVVLFGSVARPLEKEEPRPRRFRRAGALLWHEGKDVDRLCNFGTCPKGKPECLVPGCGKALFLRQHEGFALDPCALEPGNVALLFDRSRRFGPPSLDRWREIPF